MIFERVDLILIVAGVVASAFSMLATLWITLSSSYQRRLGRVVLARSFAILSAAFAEEKLAYRRTGGRNAKKPLGKRSPPL